DPPRALICALPSPDELGEEDGILVLHEHNFARALSEHRLLLVEFYAPWCRHCERLAPAFAQAATTLRNESSPARLGKVDATTQKALAGEFGITSYPTLKLFRDGNRTHPIDYTGRAAAQRDAQAFYEVAMEMVDVPFGVAEATELFQAYGLSTDTICLFKKVRERRGAVPILPTPLLRAHSLDLVMEFTSEVQPIPAPIPVGCQDPTPHAALPQQVIVGTAGTVLFVVVDVAGHGANILAFFGMTPADAPTLRLVEMKNNRKYRMEQDSFSDTAISTFIQDVLDGKVKPHLLSAEPPEDWDTQAVKVLVGKTFEQVAFDETKNVFVKFYAPWCSHCQAMAAAWEELGERYKDHEDIVIAKLDAMANEIENVTITSFPTLRYFPAGPGRKVGFKGSRDVETFSKFLENGGMLPEEPPEVSGVLPPTLGCPQPLRGGGTEPVGWGWGQAGCVSVRASLLPSPGAQDP
uniref:protein disulfide-isomerase n=1 Tax=Strigops habroptila TaxID=2489341 RepID=A0A672TPP6_STRHB